MWWRGGRKREKVLFWSGGFAGFGGALGHCCSVGWWVRSVEVCGRVGDLVARVGAVPRVTGCDGGFGWVCDAMRCDAMRARETKKLMRFPRGCWG